MPQLWEILGRKKPEHKKQKRRQKRPAQKEEKQESLPLPPKPKHTVLRLGDAKKLFVDLPKKHRFWLKSGHDISNLMELFKELEDMEDDVFLHHVRDGRNDFSSWIKEVYGDHALAARIGRSLTKNEHIRVLRESIENMKTPIEHASRKPSHINPDLGFLRKSFDKPSPPLETKRRIKPAEIQPNYEFIRKAKEHAEAVEQKIHKVDKELRTVEKKLHEADVQLEMKETQLKFYQAAKIRNNLEALKEQKAAEKVLLDELSKLSAEDAVLREKQAQLARKEARLLTIERRILARVKPKATRPAVDISAGLDKARDYMASKRFDDARLLVSKMRKEIETSALPVEEKKKAYYAMLELATDLDIAMMK